MDKIHIRALTLDSLIGVHPGERKRRRKLLINISLECDLSTGAKTDDIADTVDYEIISRKVVELAETTEFRLIETLAERIAELCLESSLVKGVTVTVDKPGALASVGSVAVEITRPTLVGNVS